MATAPVVSVPKRLVKLATRRNLARRIVREAWRGSPVRTFTEAAPAPATVLIRLSQAPNALSRSECKLILRNDIDQLLSRLAASLRPQSLIS